MIIYEKSQTHKNLKLLVQIQIKRKTIIKNCTAAILVLSQHILSCLFLVNTT